VRAAGRCRGRTRPAPHRRPARVCGSPPDGTPGSRASRRLVGGLTRYRNLNEFRVRPWRGDPSTDIMDPRMAPASGAAPPQTPPPRTAPPQTAPPQISAPTNRATTTEGTPT
jgi:hypothetical protein